jgi:hypothetical protein
LGFLVRVDGSGAGWSDKGGDGATGRYDRVPTVIWKVSPGSRLASRPGIKLA